MSMEGCEAKHMALQRYFFIFFLNIEIFIKVTKITIQQLKTQGLIHDTLYNIQPGLLHAYID